jgi:hypothetical protein
MTEISSYVNNRYSRYHICQCVPAKHRPNPQVWVDQRVPWMFVWHTQRYSDNDKWCIGASVIEYELVTEESEKLRACGEPGIPTMHRCWCWTQRSCRDVSTSELPYDYQPAVINRHPTSKKWRMEMSRRTQ